MPLETKHINLLRSAAMWLRAKAGTVIAHRFNWDEMMNSYALDLENIADELVKLNLPETVVKMEDLFK